jgi:hypothetical protein
LFQAEKYGMTSISRRFVDGRLGLEKLCQQPEESNRLRAPYSFPVHCCLWPFVERIRREISALEKLARERITHPPVNDVGFSDLTHDSACHAPSAIFLHRRCSASRMGNRETLLVHQLPADISANCPVKDPAIY